MCQSLHFFFLISNAEKMQDSLRMVLNFPAILGLACLQEWISGIIVLWFSSSTGFPKGHWLWETWQWSQGLAFTGAWQASDVASEEVARDVLFLRCIKCLGNSLFPPTNHLSIWKLLFGSLYTKLWENRRNHTLRVIIINLNLISYHC